MREGASEVCVKAENTLEAAQRENELLKDEIASLKIQLASQESVHSTGDERGRKRKKAEGDANDIELPTGVWAKIAKRVHRNDVFAFAMTSKQLREAQVQSKRELVTKPVSRKSDGGLYIRWFSRDWCLWWTRRFNITETLPQCIKAVNHVAAFLGYLDVLKHWEGVPENKRSGLWDADTCTDAALGGHLDSLKYLRSQGCPWDSDTCANAAFGGHLEVLQWARAQGCPWDAFTCECAAMNGHLEVLQWARSEGCDWNARTCKSAPKGGHFELLRWLRINGCPWNESECLEALSRKLQPV